MDIAVRAVVQAQTANWNDIELASATILDPSGAPVRRVEIRGPQFKSEVPPYDVTKSVTIVSEGLTPGRYKVRFHCYWLVQVGWGVGMAFGGGGRLAADDRLIWGEIFAPSDESRYGEVERVFDVQLS
jgi:hypothetical protein